MTKVSTYKGIAWKVAKVNEVFFYGGDDTTEKFFVLNSRGNPTGECFDTRRDLLNWIDAIS